MVFLGMFPKPVAPPPPSVHLAIKMPLLAKKKSDFQGQKQWPPKFHIKFRNPATPTPPYFWEIIPKKKLFLTPSIASCGLSPDLVSCKPVPEHSPLSECGQQNVKV